MTSKNTKINWKKLQAMAVHNLAFLSKVLNLQHFYDWLNVHLKIEGSTET